MTDVEAVQTRIDTANMTIEGQETSNSENQESLDTLTMSVNMMAAKEDFYGTNEATIIFGDAVGMMLPDAEFCVPMGVPYEFYANLSYRSMPNAYVTGLILAQTATPETALAAS